ncbi:MAG: 23S rRNA (pseudouridine(1915)-N(3))-methyltransferase RlmH [Oscillospiraceae bacterium]
MYNIELICLGKINAAFYKQAAAEYEKRLNGFCKIKVTELAEEKIDEKSYSNILIERALDKEGSAILNNIKKGSKIIILCIEGKQMSSVELADYIKEAAIQGSGDFTFVIGSSHGISDKVKNMADIKLSMSKMTFPHELARVMLLEQIYRAFSIIAGSKYHK